MLIFFFIVISYKIKERILHGEHQIKNGTYNNPLVEVEEMEPQLMH